MGRVNEVPKNTPPATPKLRHRWLYALPGAAMPAQVECDGAVYRWRETFKHDFFAATGLYEGSAGLAVLKLGRCHGAGPLPLKWVGRFLARREVTLYARVQDLRGVPRLMGRVGDTGFMHAFVPGHPLQRREMVGDTFFDELQTLLAEIHARHMAYVDLNKRQNILVGEDGRPHLIDFQISLHWPPTGWRRWSPARWLLRRFQQADVYHCLKHKRRLRPDLLNDDERRTVERVSIWIRLHRWVARPLTQLRRRVLRWLRGGDEADVAGSSAK